MQLLSRPVLGLILLTLLPQCTLEANECRLDMVARAELEIQDGLPVVPVLIDGTQLRLIVDTGAERTTIAKSVAERLRLPADPLYTTKSLGIGGISTATDVTVNRVALGGADLPLERAAVADLSLRSEHGLQADGLLGADVLLAYDLDLDMPGRSLTLYQPKLCRQTRFPWSGPTVEIDGVRPSGDRLTIPFELDGVKGMAILDSGAQRDIVGVDMTRRLGLSGRAAMAGDPTIEQHGVGPHKDIVHLHRFKRMRVGLESRESPELPVMESEAGIGDAVIGVDFLRERHVWLSYPNRRIYVELDSQGPLRAGR
jgi:hypothetical protein